MPVSMPASVSFQPVMPVPSVPQEPPVLLQPPQPLQPGGPAAVFLQSLEASQLQATPPNE